jgi:hypothetical protein
MSSRLDAAIHRSESAAMVDSDDFSSLVAKNVIYFPFVDGLIQFSGHTNTANMFISCCMDKLNA